MNKPNFISLIESQGNIFSELTFPNLKKVYDFWKTKKVIKVFQSSDMSENTIIPQEVIFKSAQGFYIFIKNQDDDWSMTIYYKIEQENELKLFTKNLIKQIKDATDNNR